VNDWPAYGVMHNLVVDGGLEFYSPSLEQVCLSLNINWIAAPLRMAWFRGKIERFLGTMNRAVAHGVLVLRSATSSKRVTTIQRNMR
jgi:putative transposase